MQIAKLVESSGQFIKDATPRPKADPPATTTRDVGTVGITTSVAVVLEWVTTDVLKIPMPTSVAVALASIGAYFIARKFRY